MVVGDRSAEIDRGERREDECLQRGHEADFEGEGITTAFNPSFLLEGLGALEEPVARLLFTTPTKPAVLRPAGGGSDYTYLIMPVRMPG